MLNLCIALIECLTSNLYVLGLSPVISVTKRALQTLFQEEKLEVTCKEWVSTDYNTQEHTDWE